MRVATHEARIGVEIHCRLTTESRPFCACPTGFGAPPESQVCPVCLAHPGALPVVDAGAVDRAVALARIHLEERIR